MGKVYAVERSTMTETDETPTPQEAVRALGGHEAELSRAATRMARAIVSGDVVELRLAASDHAAALGSQSTAMAASIASVLMRHMDTVMLPVVERLDRADSASIEWRASLRDHLDDRFDAYGLELDKLQDGLTRLTKSELAIDALRIVQEVHTQELAVLHRQSREDIKTTVALLEMRISKLEQRLSQP